MLEEQGDISQALQESLDFEGSWESQVILMDLWKGPVTGLASVKLLVSKILLSDS